VAPEPPAEVDVIPAALAPVIELMPSVLSCARRVGDVAREARVLCAAAAAEALVKSIVVSTEIEGAEDDEATAVGVPLILTADTGTPSILAMAL
jgi:hypothetical protein